MNDNTAVDLVIDTQESVRRIGLDRPPANALPSHMWTAITGALDEVNSAVDVRAVVLHGAEGRFCAGADISELANPDPAADDAAMLTVVSQAASAVRACRVPVIAAIDGPAHGGGLELALACDIRVASSQATFAASGVNVGLIASVGSLVDAVGDTIARRMLLTGEQIDAVSAQRWGLITEIVDAPNDAALALASSIASKAPLAIEATKAALNDLPAQSPEERRAALSDTFRRLIGTADHREAIAAFLEKRTPNFGRG